MPELAYVALGSNLGNRHATLESARRALASLPGTRVVAATPVEETAPIGPVEQRDFLNQMVELETSLTPDELLDALLEIETEHGRVRTERWGPRTLDLDIVRYEHAAIATPRLTVPHPELPYRDFWQRELALLREDR